MFIITSDGTDGAFDQTSSATGHTVSRLRDTEMKERGRGGEMRETRGKKQRSMVTRKREAEKVDKGSEKRVSVNARKKRARKRKKKQEMKLRG